MRQKEVIHDRETALQLLCASVATVHPTPSGIIRPMPIVSEPRKKRCIVAQTVQPAAKVHRRCHCGICRVCQDNAHWERVFREKFADLDYYSGLRVSQRSPLADF